MASIERAGTVTWLSALDATTKSAQAAQSSKLHSYYDFVENPFNIYSAAFYWAVITTVSVGYGGG